MSAGRGITWLRVAVAWSGVWAIGALFVGCVWFEGKAKPGWIDGASADYPPAQYLIGVGQADNRSVAADQAYAAVARIFRAEVATHARDWESYLVIEQRGSSNTERKLTLETVTNVTTEKTLENVSIADTWYDSKKDLHYALAVMNRVQAEVALMERMAMLDQAIESDVEESRHTTDNLATVRSLRRAARHLVLREAYNADLRVIRPSGQGTAASYRVSELSAELEQFLATHLVMSVQVSGDHTEPVRRALTEGLIREGLHVLSETSSEFPDLLVRGTVRLFPIEVKDPQFRFVRWCSDFDVVEAAAGHVVGAVTRGGKEGHLTEREAMAKALRVIQQEVSTDVARAIASHIFGEAVLPARTALPAGCPRGELPAN